MRRSIKELVRITAGALPIAEPIYEFGSLQVIGSSDSVDLRPIFPGKEYVGCDMREGPGVDLTLDLHQIQLPDNTAGTVLIMDTLEHVEYPHKAMAEVHRITRDGGMVVISSVMNFHIHAYPCDYWRFTPEAFKSLLQPFSDCFVDFAGEPDFPHTVFGIGFKKAGTVTDEFTQQFEKWKKRWFYPEGSSWKQVRKQVTPPILRTWSKKIGRRVRHAYRPPD